MCFIFVTQINVIFMRPLYETNILCDCIINVYIRFMIVFMGQNVIYGGLLFMR